MVLVKYWLSVNDCIESLLLSNAVLFVYLFFFPSLFSNCAGVFLWLEKYSLETPYLYCLYFCSSTNGIALVKIGSHLN